MKKLTVYLNESAVGQLFLDNSGQMKFSYAKDWLNTPDATPLSCSLPLTEEIFSQKQCQGYFAGILPEESNRKAIAQLFGISLQNDYAMLKEIGGECAGAVSFLPQEISLPQESDYHYRKLSTQQLITYLEQLATRPLLTGEQGLRLSLAGAQDKLALRMDNRGNFFLPLNGAPSTHIIKPENKRFPNLAANEALCLNLAKAIGIPAVEANAHKIGSIPCLLVKRYDRIEQKDKSHPVRLHQEDFCQALGIPPHLKYQNEGGPSLMDCFSLIRKVSSLPAVDLKNLLDTVIFNLIIINNDAHAKNFSFLFSQQNTVRLAPAYDLLSTGYYSELSPKMAMKIGKEYNYHKLRFKNFEQFALAISFNLTAVKKRVIEVAQKIKHHLPIVGSQYKAIGNLQQVINHRALWFINLMQETN